MNKGKVWKYGSNINTDIITPPASLELSIDEAKKYAMSAVDPDFAGQCSEGDIFVAEHNLGSGSSRETSPLVLKRLGITTVIAMDYARIFYRNCINIGLLALECRDADKIEKGDELEIHDDEGYILDLTKNERYECSRIPEHIRAIIDCGGLIPYIRQNRV